MKKRDLRKGTIETEHLLESRKIVDKLYDDFWKKKKTRKYSDTHIFDENKTVRWNRDEVERLNKEIDDEIEVLKEKYVKANKDWQDEVIKAAMDSYGYTEDMVKLILGKAYEYGHSDGINDVLNYFSDFLDFVEDVLDVALED